MSSPPARTCSRGVASRSAITPSRMSLTSRVHKLITGPTPSVGSDDWPSRYIWRWICRRNAAATSVAARAITVRRQIADARDQDDADQPQSEQRRKCAQVASQAKAARELAPQGPVPADARPDSRPAGPCAASGKTPVSVNTVCRASSPVARLLTHCGSRPTARSGKRASPREASTDTKIEMMPSRTTSNSDCTNPKTRATM